MARRVDGRAINKRVLEHLVKTGAFDYSGASRKKLFESIDSALAGAASQARDRAAGQFSLLDMLDEAAPEPKIKSGSVDRTGSITERTAGDRLAADASGDNDFTPAEKLQFEKELLGFYVSGHPMNLYTGLAEALDTFPPDLLLNQTDRTDFRLCGIAANLTKKLSKKDNRPWSAFTLATRKASIPLNMFADAFAAYGTNLAENALVLVQGNVLVSEDGARINVKECYPLDHFVTNSVKRVTWLLNPEHPELNDFLRQLRDTLNKQVGETKLSIGFVFENRITAVSEASNALGWKLDALRFQELRAHPAVVGVELETKRLEIKETRRWARKSG
jgi:DNA polymerase-3 subunit alpha